MTEAHALPPLPIDYNAWAATYDTTRRASPRLLAALLEALGPARARRLLDIGGGTGNVALPLDQAGFRVTVCDRAPQMLQRAAHKLPPGVPLTAAVAEHLPYQRASFDCAICINVVRHLTDPGTAFAEARRVLRAGPLVMRTTTRETEQAHWAYAYFPTLRSVQPPAPTELELVAAVQHAGFAQVAVQHFHYHGDNDGSFQALKYDPQAVLEGAVTGNVAVFKRLPAAERAHGVAAVRRDLASGRLAAVIATYQPAIATYGDGVILVAYPDAVPQTGMEPD